jgi:hypothetical protein
VKGPLLLQRKQKNYNTVLYFYKKTPHTLKKYNSIHYFYRKYPRKGVYNAIGSFSTIVVDKLEATAMRAIGTK